MGLLLIKKKNPDCANSFGIGWKTLDEPNKSALCQGLQAMTGKIWKTRRGAALRNEDPAGKWKGLSYKTENLVC